jgi:imidazoleglycerol phosphate synthase glutamine amidotransferase subunit HisH
MLLPKSEEFGAADGLDIIKGNVVRIPESPEAIPNAGWKRLFNVSTDRSRLSFA